MSGGVRSTQKDRQESMTKAPTYPPIPTGDWPDTINHLRDDFAGKLNVYKVMAHHPDLLCGWESLRRHVVTRNALGPERLEIAILRTAARLGAQYEWAHHVDRAGKLGFSSERINGIAAAPEGMSPEDAVIARSVDRLIDDKRLDPASLEALENLVGKEGVFDLMATVGFYLTLGFIVESFDVPLDSDIPSVAVPHGR